MLKKHCRDHAYRKISTVGAKCEECGSPENLERHHTTYEDPLAVRILCRGCHNKAHHPNPGALVRSRIQRVPYERYNGPSPKGVLALRRLQEWREAQT